MTRNPSELLREATQLSGVDMDAAIFCLQCFKDIADYGFGIKSFLRLPLYLQKAGRFDEAKAEFQFLLDTVNNDKGGFYSSRLSKSDLIMLRHAHLFTIYDKMRLAYQREGLHDIAKEYAKLYEIHKAAHQQAMQERRKKISEKNLTEKNTAPSVDYFNPPPATKTVTVKGGAYSTKENAEAVAGCFLLIAIAVAVIWAIVHFVF